MKLLSCILLTLALVMTAAAADVTGKWSGSFAIIGPDGTPGESNPAYMVLKQTGNTLSGTAGQDESNQVPIQNPKIEGNKISGTVEPGDGSTYVVMLTVNGDKMTGEVTATQGGQTMKAKIEFKRVSS